MSWHLDSTCTEEEGQAWAGDIGPFCPPSLECVGAQEVASAFARPGIANEQGGADLNRAQVHVSRGSLWWAAAPSPVVCMLERPATWTGRNPLPAAATFSYGEDKLTWLFEGRGQRQLKAGG